MKSNSGKAKTRIRFGNGIGVALLLLAAGTQSVLAQSNTFPNSGNVGVGTTSPQAKLDVRGSSSYDVSGVFSAIYAKGTADYPMALILDGGGTNDGIARMRALNNGATKWQLNFMDDLVFYSWTNNTFLNALTLKNNGNVGIGTASPSDLLQLDSPAGWGLRIRYTGDGQYLRISANQVSSFTSAGVGRDLYLNTAGGNVGIGTTSPTSRLHVAGDGRVTGSVTVDGNINAKYQDVAEWVPVSQQLPAGTVVVLDTTKSNQVTSSSQSYDTRVAGVVSARPGLALGESGTNKVLVATTGRVLVKVDASRAPIHIGDLLVTSDVPGLAMKSEPINIGGAQIHRPGTLIGKALEPIEKGSGKIPVLLSLQ
ncbi:MAG: hypothetical protein QOH70_642 [Blastocatellia bacterium]|jgi:hypothetical protein|nr:hypothetical protein [Blastocatellia bacterium]